MSVDYSEPIIQAAEEIAVALKVLTEEIRALRKTHDRMLTGLEELVHIQDTRPRA